MQIHNGGMAMNEPKRLERNQERLTELYPTFSKRVASVIAELEKRGYRPRIQDAWRSIEDQRKAYESGHSKLKFGFHNITADDGTPEALAVDLLDDDFPLASRKAYLLNLVQVSEKNGLTTGIRWGLTAKLSAGVDAAIAAEDWTANVKIGWDPTHVEPTGITVKDAKNGRRPA